MKRILSSSPGIAGLLTVAVVAATAGPALADPVAGNLPGGTSIGVSIDSPADGAVLPLGPVTIAGTAEVGMGEPVAETALVYVVDVSTSTNALADCPDTGDTILNCEVAAARALNQEAISAGTVGAVGAVFFAGDALAADVRPAGGVQLVTEPATADAGAAMPDIELVLSSAGPLMFTDFSQADPRTVPDLTNFEQAVAAATTVATSPDNTMDSTIVAFLSDGQANQGNVGNVLPAPDNVSFFTFAVGTASDQCEPNGGGVDNSLQRIADETGGTCTYVPTVADLPDILPEVIAAELSSLSLSINGGPATAITDVMPALPQEGPAGVDYTITTAPLPAGQHELCVTAAGSDFGGQGDVTDCHTITINAPPEVDAGGPYAGQEGAPVAIAGTVTDPDSPGVVSEWSIEPTGNVDPGTTCEIDDPAAVSTTVTCTDDGTFTLTLTADDSVNPPVADSTTVELANVAPVVSISAPDDGELVAAGTPVEFVAPFTDQGSNDTHTCTVDFDDGTPVADGTVDQSPGSGTCTITHAFTELGPHQVQVTVTDDNGGIGTAAVTVVIYLPGEAFVISASGPVTIPKTPHATCPPDESLTLAQLNVGIATVNGLNADCTVDPATGETVAAASVNQASLLGGAITISNINSSCVANADGITRSSNVGTINGIPIGTGSGSLTIPLVATVFYNETTTNAEGQLVQNAVRVQTLLGQQIILAGCRLG